MYHGQTTTAMSSDAESNTTSISNRISVESSDCRRLLEHDENYPTTNNNNHIQVRHRLQSDATTATTNKCAIVSSNTTNRNNMLDTTLSKKIVSVIPRERQQLLKWNGWGYKDSKFVVKGIPENPTDQDKASATIAFTGNRYPIGNLELPNFAQWVFKMFNLDLTQKNVPKPMPAIFPEAVPCAEFIQAVRQIDVLVSTDGEDRLIRSHGQTLHDIHTLREGLPSRIPDVVVWPVSHEDVVKLVRIANDHNVAVIPFGGGTSVSGSISCPQHEHRAICALDTSQMNRMLWLDRNNMVACFESGIFGQDLERELRLLGLMVGHEPDSYEFSTLGGWVATRASGMKKNVYGNIEDLVVRVKMVTSCGVLERNCSAPRVSCGPDFNQMILGSEGTLGVITEVVLKVRPLPEVKQYGSLVFPDFANGVKALREIAAHRLQPASIRLVDNEQFQFGQALKPPSSLLAKSMELIKRFYLTKIKRFNVQQMCVATLVFEGDADEVKRQEQRINEIAAKYLGIAAGAENGERGYVLTFVIAYIRDLALEYFIVAESFETSVPWDRCETLCTNTKQRVRKECSKMNIHNYLISCRVTQTYDAGAAVYFYFGFNYTGLSDPVSAYEHIENCARDEILACGGSLSHHHGVGKLRSRWYPQTVGAVGVGLYKAAKAELDPKNIFAAGNLLPNNNATTDLHTSLAETFKSKL